MAKRYVYSYNERLKKIDEIEVEFDWYPGFSISQKQKSIISLHSNYREFYPNQKVLEISSKSSKEIGVRLSAFNLKYSSEYLKKTVSVETVFQAAKVFEGEETPNVEIMNMNPNEAKSYIKTKQSRKLKKFILGDIEFGLMHYYKIKI